METANLTAVSQQVNYGYYFGQLMQIDYPQNPENNVSYAYGVSGNEAGRISKSQDASGVHAYEYGNMGELVKKISTGVVPVSGGETYSFATRWEYDSWNRIRTIQYPDGELVAYDYDNGGQLIHMQGNKATTQNYVNNILYDEFGSRTYFEYGNGVYSNYIYNNATRWLQNLTTTSTNGSLHNITYTYGSVGNRAWTLRRSPAQALAGEMNGTWQNGSGSEQIHYSYFGARYGVYPERRRSRRDAGLSIWLSVDPMADKYPAWSPYAYTLQSPIILIDPTGMSAEWFETPDGQIKFDPNIKSQADLKTKGIEGKYLGAQGIGINKETRLMDTYNADGSITENAGTMSGPMIDIGGSMTDHQRTMSNPVVQAVHAGQRAFVTGATELIQNSGSVVSLAGYALTLSGVGAPVGIPLAVMGGTMSLAGSALEATMHFGDGNSDRGFQSVGFAVAGRFLPSSIKIDGLGGEVLRQGTALKVDGVSKLLNLNE